MILENTSKFTVNCFVFKWIVCTWWKRDETHSVLKFEMFCFYAISKRLNLFSQYSDEYDGNLEVFIFFIWVILRILNLQRNVMSRQKKLI